MKSAGGEENDFSSSVDRVDACRAFCIAGILCSFDKRAILHLCIVMILVILAENLLKSGEIVIYFKQRYFVYEIRNTTLGGETSNDSCQCIRFSAIR